jgi:hypothetical protein
MNRLEPVEKAEYDATISVVQRGCTDGTHRQILSQLLDWALDTGNTKIYWLNGMAGMGKTTIAYSFSEILRRLGMLGGTFFCLRNDSDCSAAKHIPLTIAFQLALSLPHILEALTQILDENLSWPDQNIGICFDRVIVQPLCKARPDFPRLPVIIIDALDECADQRHVEEFLANLWQHAPSLPVKFFVTSQLDPQFHGRIYSKDTLAKKFHLHNVEESFVQKDIHLYIQEQLGEFMDNGQKWFPLLKKLVEKARQLFIYAAMACKYIMEAMDGLHFDRLQSITTIREVSSELQTGDTDELYTLILREVYLRRETREKEDLDLILQAVISVMVPLSIEALAELLNLDGRKVCGMLSRLHSVICVPEGNGLVMTLHALFREYLRNAEYSSTSGCMSADATMIHGCLMKSSFNVMNTNLHFNISDFPSSFLSNSALTPSIVKKAILGSLSYACQFWGFHMEKSHTIEVDLFVLKKFVEKKLLFWFEALSCLQKVNRAAPTLATLHGQLMSLPVEVRVIPCGVCNLLAF